MPITSLLKKNQQSHWSPEVQTAFDKFKTLFTSVSILKHFDPDLQIILHADSSGFAISGIISQSSNGVLYPIAYWSRKCTSAECNYDIHDREMLAIVECMKHWHHYLESSKFPVHVRSDHKNLERFMTTKILNRRQTRWAEILSGYDFVLDHIAGAKNPADGPSRRPDYAENVTLSSGTLIPQSALRLLPFSAGPTPGNNSSSVLPSLALAEASLSSSGTTRLISSSVFSIETSLRQRFRDALSIDPIPDKHRNTRINPSTPVDPWSWENGFLLFKNLI